jgi:hypothetical protein
MRRVYPALPTTAKPFSLVGRSQNLIEDLKSRKHAVERLVVRPLISLDVPYANTRTVLGLKGAERLYVCSRRVSDRTIDE